MGWPRLSQVREGDRTRRAPVQIGIETPAQVEIAAGINAGDIIGK